MIIPKIQQKIQRNIADYGISTTLLKGARLLLSPIFYHQVYRIYCIDLDKIGKLEDKQLVFKFKLVQPGDNEIIREIESMEEWLQGTVKEKLMGSTICLAAIDNGKVAGFNIVSFGKVYIPLLKMFRHLSDDEAWSEQITVSKDFRRLGLGYEIRCRVFRELIKRKIKRFLGGTLKSNHASLGLARRLGFQEIEDVHYLKLFGFKKWTHRGVKK